ncbi:MAG: M81 family metallopeptidase [Oscillospiraceae bacterium]|nr:M81 family metallopeptidase [Oscillospiraceae bacterium]
MNILYFEFSQETNSFNPLLCDLDCFKNWTYREGEHIFTDLDPSVPIETMAFAAAAKEAGATLVPSIAMVSQSQGPVTADVVDLFLDKVRATYETMEQVDGVFAALHGGTQDTREDDVCGYILEQVRAMVGPEPVIAVAYDMHGNITPKMLHNSDVCCGYQTYPHEDPYETGYRAAKLGLMKLRDRSAFVMTAVHLPMILPCAGYSTKEEGPFKEITELGHRFVEEGKLLDFSLFQMQPWMDVDPACSTVIAIGREEAVAAACAQELAQRLFDVRKELKPDLMTIDQVIDLALDKETPKPVILANTGDSTNGGAVGDNTAVLQRLIERKAPLRFATMLRDPGAVEQAFAVGVGGEAEFSLGAFYNKVGQVPAKVRGRVRSLHDGDYFMEGPYSKGLPQHVGRAAVISVGDYYVMACHSPANTGDPQIYRHFGLEPKLFDLVEVKANTSYRLPFSAFASVMCTVDVPGCVGVSDLRSLPFQNIPRPFYPFDEMDGYCVGKAICYN